MMKLFTGPLSMFGAKVQIAALEKRLTFEVLMVPFDTDDRYEPRHPEVLRINPKRHPGALGHVHGCDEAGKARPVLRTFERRAHNRDSSREHFQRALGEARVTPA